jgi:predicted protein tyrosine phosphatase
MIRVWVRVRLPFDSRLKSQAKPCDCTYLMGSEAAQTDHQKEAFAEFQNILLPWHATKPFMQILSRVLLGDAEDARNIKELKRRGVTHVMNLASDQVETGNEFYNGAVITYTRWACEDSLEYDIMRHYDDFAQIADDVASCDTPGLLLVHCAGGINRSGTLCIAYYAVRTGLPLIQCTKACKQLRDRICTNAA